MDSEKISRSPRETAAFGRELAEEAGLGAVIALEAQLGGGKTVFAKGFAQASGIRDDAVTSPTFSLVNRYALETGYLYHIDLYRIGSVQEAEEIGIREMLCSGDTVMIEWPERIGSILNEISLFLVTIVVAGCNERLIRICRND